MLAALILSIAGIGVAGYLTFVHYDEGALVCTVGSCETVQQSEYATIGSVPIAILGVGMYVALAALALARLAVRGPISSDNATVAAWIIALSGALYAAYLTYVELWVIDAVCQWCVASAVITLCILAIESVQLWRVLDLDSDPNPAQR